MEVQLTQLPQQGRQLTLAVQVDAVAGDVLGDDDALLHTGLGQLLRLGQHVLHAAASVLAPQGGDDAEGAAVVAALGDAEVGEVFGRGQHPVKLVDHAVDVAEAAGRAAGDDLLQRRDDLAVAARAHDAVHLRQLVQDLLLIALGEAAGDEDLAHQPLLLQRRHGEDGVDGLLLGAVDEAAGVDDHHVRAGVFSLQGVPGVPAQGHHLLGVDQVLGTAKGYERYFHGVYLTLRLCPAPAR